MDVINKIFDTHDPDNQIGPLLVAVIVTGVIVILDVVFALAKHHLP